MLGARFCRCDRAGQIGSLLDFLVIEEKDDVAFFNLGLISSAVLCDFSYKRAFCLLKTEALGKFRSQSLNDDSELAAMNLAVFNQIVLDLERQVDRNCERKSHEAAGSGEDLGVDTDHFTFHIEKRTAGVAGVDGRIRLNERNKLIARQVTAFCGNDTAGDGIF